MFVLRILLILSLTIAAIGWRAPELWFGAALPLGMIMAAAALLLMLAPARGNDRERRFDTSLHKGRWGGRFPTARSERQKILVDGSNVLHWGGMGPEIATLHEVLQKIDEQGLEPVVYFDANVGYLIGEKWLGAGPLARKLGLGYRNVIVADSGTPADPLLLEASRRSGARVVSNDRYRDWHGQFPEAAEPGRTVRGRMEAGSVSLAL